METHYTVERRIRLCTRCTAKCEMDPPIVGCESIMAPMPPLELAGKSYSVFCQRRTWFDKHFKPVSFWRWPIDEEFETLTEKQWEEKLRKELEALQSGKCTKRL